MSDQWIVLGFFQTREASAATIKELHNQNIFRSACIHSDDKFSSFIPHFGINQRTIRKFQRWVLPGETLILTKVSSNELEKVTNLLQHSSGEVPLTFTFRPTMIEGHSHHGAGRKHTPLTVQALRVRAHRMAVGLRPSNRPFTKKNSLLQRLHRSIQDFGNVNHALLTRSLTQQSPSMFAVLLLDNSYIIQEHIDDIKRNLPHRFYDELPVSTHGAYSGLPRIYSIAAELLPETDTRFDKVRVITFLNSFQAVSPLTIGELWAIPQMLRLRLIECIHKLALTVEQRESEREYADLWANRLLTAERHSPEMLQKFVDILVKEHPTPSAHLADELIDYLFDEDRVLSAIHLWLENSLGYPLADVIQQERIDQSTDQVALSDAIWSLRQLSQLDWRDLFEDLSIVHTILSQDPAGTYIKSDFETRDKYRHAIEEIAKSANKPETQVATYALELASKGTTELTKNIGYYTLDSGKRDLEVTSGCPNLTLSDLSRWTKANASKIYLSLVALITTVLISYSIHDAYVSGTPLPIIIVIALLSVIPISELVLNLVNSLVTRIFKPSFLPRMSYEHGIPEECKTLIVVPMMLLTPDSIRKEVEHLEIRYLANPDPNIMYGLLSDFSDGPNHSMPEDAERLDVVVNALELLNRQYGDSSFFLFHRSRQWSESEQCWIGRERKRGKLEELNSYLAGDMDGIEPDFVRVGEPSNLAGVRYVLTLDADTQLPRDTARNLIETISHPLNTAILDKDQKKVVRGYALIQPGVKTSLPSATASRFSRLFTDASGTDPYTHANSDVNQDLTGEGSYYGKGIYDVHVFHKLLRGVFPKENLLSHDLIEGAHIRVGLASSIELLDQFPEDYLSYMLRNHRWVRGDWQIASWLFPVVYNEKSERVVNSLSFYNRWKIADNLRRSLLQFSSISLLLVAWFFSSIPFEITLLLGLVCFLPVVNSILSRFTSRPKNGSRAINDLVLSSLRSVIDVSLLPQEAVNSVDAIVRVLYRKMISKRRLLEWETAQEAHRKSKNRQLRFVTGMLWISAFSIVILLFALLKSTHVAEAASPFLLLWICSPLAVVWMNSPIHTPNSMFLTENDKKQLRYAARLTWRFFDDFIGVQTNFLPPDNFQETLRVEVAQRTSPTNIGLGLLNPFSALDLGYLTIDQVIAKTIDTLKTVDKLEKYEGHLLNWYNIQTLEPLEPRYVSMVDSGNFLGDLLALEQATEDLISHPVINPSIIDGLKDTAHLTRSVFLKANSSSSTLPKILDGLDIVLSTNNFTPEGLFSVIESIHNLALDLIHSEGELDQESAYWTSQIRCHIAELTRVIDNYLPWIRVLLAPPDCGLLSLGTEAHEWRRQALANIPSLKALAAGDVSGLRGLVSLHLKATEFDIPQEVLDWLQVLSEAEQKARKSSEEMLQRADYVILTVQKIMSSTNMSFLFDIERHLFSTGFNVSERRMDPGRYDLLASEARLGSFLSIARGEVPVQHWWALGRPYGTAYGVRALLSWSGTMFEYLMPLLLTRSYENSMLHEACKSAVQCQMAYARKRDMPWGVSEAAFSALDSNRIYQYRAFGVPGLGIKRGLEDDVVVAPYATALALPFAPVEAVRNLQKLSQLGMLGTYGYYESIDYTRQQKPEGDRGVIVYTYMAHHQGMIFTAIDNALNNEIWQRRFHQNPNIRATESILYERIPDSPALVKVNVEKEQIVKLSPLTVPPSEGRTQTPYTPIPKTHLLSNGTYSVMITNSGGGYSRWENIDISRWTADTTRDYKGSFCYIKDLSTGYVWSNTFQPVCNLPKMFSVSYSVDKAAFQRTENGIETNTEIIVSTEDNVEIRRITLLNRTQASKHLELTSYQEIALASHNADRAHPVFSKMFIETESLPELDSLLAHRRPRASTDAQLWTVHTATDDASFEMFTEFETNRELFIGRGRTPKNPLAMQNSLSNSSGYVMDPIFSLRRRVTLEPGQRVEIAFITGAGNSRETVVALAEKYGDLQTVHRAFEMAWTYAQLELRHLRISQDEAQLFQQIASHLIYPNALFRPPTERLASNTLGQTGLWAYGISGDLPICVITIADMEDIVVIKQLLVAHSYWKARGLKNDLVILNEEVTTYDQPLQNQLVNLINAHHGAIGTERAGGIYLKQMAQIPDKDRTLILCSARVVLSASRGVLSLQLGMPAQNIPTPPLLIADKRINEEQSAPLPFMELLYFNGLGGFTQDGREYAIYLAPGDVTPMPWVNVIANPSFGIIVSESGSGFAWHKNSQSNRITPWMNDPISDTSCDTLYIRDEEMGVYWTPTPLPIREEDAYRIRHGQGYTAFEHNSHAIEQHLTTYVPVDDSEGDPVRVQNLRLTNRSSRKRRLSVIFYCDLVLGVEREDNQMHVQTEWDTKASILIAKNFYNADFGGSVAFAATSSPVTSYSGDRTMFLGRNGSAATPSALARKVLSGRIGAGFDPCMAIQVTMELQPGESRETIFLLGEADNIDHARSLVNKYRSVETAKLHLQNTKDWWNRLLETLQVETPDQSANLLLNRWLLYQSLSCRLWGRSALYQSGGAFGFRDQLQDVMALVYAHPTLARQQIVISAARQFKEGDVQHWWHPPSGAGVRTRMTDDLLWLPFVTAQYVRITGDKTILDEMITFIESPPLQEGEDELFNIPAVSELKLSLLEHCGRAILKGTTAGAHGLPLIGTGDWNDSLSRVGIEGKGESVWLAWFLVHVLQDFAELLEMKQRSEEAAQYRTKAMDLAATLESSAWDGNWYLRGFFDDGTPLGSHLSEEDKIDSLGQSWNVISGLGDPYRARIAMNSVDEHLIRREDKMVLLFTPPFDRSPHDPGYIKGYPPGVRENGGQYTHGSLWVPMAFARMNDGDRAVEILRMMNPIEHSRSEMEALRYRVEPYVVAADIYELPGAVGRGGWTWYTGSAAWMYRVWIEEVLGLQVRGNSLTLAPKIASEWNGFTMKYRYRNTDYEIVVDNSGHVSYGVGEMELDGVRVESRTVQLKDDGMHHVVNVKMAN